LPLNLEDEEALNELSNMIEQNLNMRKSILKLKETAVLMNKEMLVSTYRTTQPSPTSVRDMETQTTDMVPLKTRNESKPSTLTFFHRLQLSNILRRLH
jgi:hypothetical protein